MPKFNKEDILKYYDILGLDRNDEGLIVRDSINLNYISDLYELNEFDKKLSYTAKELSDVYSLLIQMIKDGFWYTSKTRREEAYNAAMDVISDLTKFNIVDKDNEDLTNDRRNNLKSTIIKGLCESGDIITFRFYQKNSSFNSVYNKITEIEKEERNNDMQGLDYDKEPEDLMKLYYLIALSKFKSNGCDYEMFDGTGKIFMTNLKMLVRRNVYEDVPLNDTEKRELSEDKKILRLSNYKKKDF